MNTYAKFCPNVFVAKCPDAHQKGDVIILTSKYGKETEVEIHNLVKTSEDAYFYSFTRCDGVNSQVRAEQKAERYQNAANNALKRSEQYCEAANEGREFLRLGEPIKIGHHSEKRHRALIERNARRMDKSIEEMRKAESYDGKIAYWEKHQELKDKPELRTHAFSLTYAKKAVNELEKKVKLAELLWA
ncbi:MAG: DUF3560 domain-containing protein [Haemophilus parainfluenzae]|nr:DUF3560 domain-containing protein [Haemophilus parainfluenzae]